MFILSVKSAFPGVRHEQKDLLKELVLAWGDRVSEREKSLLERLAQSAGVKFKHLAMPPEDYKVKVDFSERNKIFQKVACELGEKVIKEACLEAELIPSDLSAIFFTTVTGIAVPSIDSRLIRPVGLRESVKRIPLFGLGCVAGAAGIARVHDYLKAYPKQSAVLLSVELCSLTLQVTDLSPESIIASALFGDGAAAVICVGEEHPLASKAKLQTLTSMSRLYPNSSHIMGWDVGSHGFKILLDPGVPQIVERYFAQDVGLFLRENKLAIGDIGTWISHPGGPKVLKAIESTLGLDHLALEVSREQLSKTGNLSSASILNILEHTMEKQKQNQSNLEERCKTKPHAMMMAMGPGFCSELVLASWLY